MNVCEWWSLRSALAHFVTFRGSTQSQRHIKPLHWYVACPVVVEGGFDPEEMPYFRSSTVPLPMLCGRVRTGVFHGTASSSAANRDSRCPVPLSSPFVSGQ